MCRLHLSRDVRVAPRQARARAAVRKADNRGPSTVILVLGLMGVTLAAILGWGTIVQAVLGGGLH